MIMSNESDPLFSLTDCENYWLALHFLKESQPGVVAYDSQSNLIVTHPEIEVAPGLTAQNILNILSSNCSDSFSVEPTPPGYKPSGLMVKTR
jgi:hypothetical protein